MSVALHIIYMYVCMYVCMYVWEFQDVLDFFAIHYWTARVSVALHTIYKIYIHIYIYVCV